MSYINDPRQSDVAEADYYDRAARGPVGLSPTSTTVQPVQDALQTLEEVRCFMARISNMVERITGVASMEPGQPSTSATREPSALFPQLGIATARCAMTMAAAKTSIDILERQLGL